MKKLLCNTLIIIIMLGVFCNGYFGFSGLSFSNRVSYAEADNWTSCDSSDLVTAFRYYCKSRNLAIEGSLADSLTSFTTTTFNNLCSTLGIDPTELQAELKKTTSGNLGLRFLFSNTGITAYNRLFSEFLQNNDLEVGDDVNNKTLYSGKYYTDSDGNSCMVFVLDGYNTLANQDNDDFVLQHGTYYKYSQSNIKNMYDNGNTSLSFGTSSLSIGQSTNSAYGGSYIYIRLTNYIPSVRNGNNLNYIYGIPIICTVDFSDFRLGVYSKTNNVNSSTYKYWISVSNKAINDPDKTVENADIYLTTNNNTINNNYYNNNWTIIYNDGDTYINNDDPEPPVNTPPSGGDDPVNPDPSDPLDPYDPNKPFPDTPDNPTPDPGVHGSPGSDGTITIPDFNFDIPDINWSLDGLQHKFPFSLPFDLYNACKLLNAEPQTPELDYTVDLVVYQWPIQMDLHWLDPAARVIRIFELLAFVVGLILITRHLIGG